MTDELLARLRDIPPFSDVTPQTLEALAGQLQRRRLAPGETFVEAGAAAHEAFVVLEGRVEVVAATADAGEPTVLAELGPDSVVGEVAVLTAAQRTATLRASEATELLVIPAPSLRQVLERSPVVASHLRDQARQRLDGAALARHLARLFPDMASAARVAIAADAEPVALAPGQVLFAQGDPADAAYLVVSGRLRVVLDGGEETVEPIAEVGAGELVGEAALVEGGRRSATVVSARDSALARFTREAFAGLVLREPGAALPVARLVLARSRDARDPYRRAAAGQTSVALVPLGDSVDTDALAGRIAAQWSAVAAVTHVSRAAVGHALGADEVADAAADTLDELRLVEWLTNATAADELTLLQADAGPSAWTRRCVGSADHVVLVADARTDPGLRDHEHGLLAERPFGHQRVSLVLVHPEELDHPRGTAAWLDARDVDGHHHVRPTDAGDVARLARHLAGRPVGLVLGGGGARGFAQLGAVRALAESGVPIDMVAGTSIGATMAALVALSAPGDDLVSAAKAVFGRPIDYTLPVAGVAKGRRVAQAAAAAAGDRRIEDFWVPLLCTSTNLTRGRLRLHTRGSVAHAIRASVAIPGVLPPVPDGDDLLVDGGLLNNLPIDVVRQRHPSATLIAVDVAPPLGPRAKEDYGLAVSGTGVLWRRLVPGLRAPKVPGVTSTLMRALIVGAASDRDRHVGAGLADLYLPLDLRGVGMLDFEAVADIVERGYKAAAEPVAAWLDAYQARWW